MSEPQRFIVVVESGLSDSAYGAKITTTDPLTEPEGLEILAAIARGEKTDVYSPYKKGRTVRVSERQLLDLSTPRMTAGKQSRITLAEVLSERS